MADNFKATVNGKLSKIQGCVLVIPGERGDQHRIKMTNLPDISDSKQAVYNNEGIIGRSAPLYTYSHSGDRNISMQIHFFVTQDQCANGNCGQCPDCNLESLRWIQSALYPRKGTNTPYLPPPICRIKCGDLLAKGNRAICVALQSYNVRFPTEVAWDTRTGCPYRFDVDTSWLSVYSTEKLPYQNRIYNTGR